MKMRGLNIDGFVCLSLVYSFTQSFVYGDVLQPFADNREFKQYQLENGMVVMTVHDPKASIAGYAAGVKAGSFQDPTDFLGLAHFIEHLSFLGSKEYPGSEEYQEYVSERGGYSNAFTENESTVYYSDIKDKHLYGGLHRFAAFLKEPLLKKVQAGLEVHAVDSEHKKNIPNPDERVIHLVHSMAHGPLGLFHTGNMQTLWSDQKKNGVDIGEKIQKFHSQYYCPQNMSVVTISTKSNDDQLELIESAFGNWENKSSCKDHEPPTVMPYDESNTGQWIHVESIDDPALWVFFPLPELLSSYKKVPLAYFSYFLGYKGSGSLNERLQKQGLIGGMDIFDERNSANTLLGIKMSLTDKGLSEKETILDIVFGFLNSMKEEGVDTRTLETLREQSIVDFHTLEPTDAIGDDASRLAFNLLWVDPEDVLSRDILMHEKDDTLTARLIEALNPAQSIIVFADPNFEQAVKPSEVSTDPYYFAKYRSRHFHDELLNHWQNTRNNGDYPPPLSYVPKLLFFKPPTTSDERKPRLLKDENGSRIWYHSLGSFKKPQVFVHLYGRLEESQMDVKLSTAAQLYTLLVNSAAEQHLADMNECGASFRMSFNRDGFLLSFEAITESQMKFLLDEVPKLLRYGETGEVHTQYVPTKHHMVNQLKESYSSMLIEDAVLAAEIVTKRLMFDKMDHLKVLNSPEFDAYFTGEAQHLLRRQNVEVFLGGDIGEADGQQLVEGFIRVSRIETIPWRAAARDQNIAIPRPLNVKLKTADPEDKNHCTLLEFVSGVPSIGERAMISLLGRMLNQHMFDKLRTEQQLGYVVGAAAIDAGSVKKLRIMLQGDNADSAEQLRRLHLELETFEKTLDSISQDQLDTWSTSLASELSEQPHSSRQQIEGFWAAIRDNSHCFNLHKLEAHYLRHKEVSPLALKNVFTRLVKGNAQLAVQVDPIDGDKTVETTIRRELLKKSADSEFKRSTKTLPYESVIYGTSVEAMEQINNSLTYYPNRVWCQI